MRTLILTRGEGNDDGTPGFIAEQGVPICLTLEEAWRDNQHDISCIPKGEYTCNRVITAGHGETFQIMNVLGRGGVLFHSGNTEVDTKGCVLTGMEFGEIKAVDDQSGLVELQMAVLRSKEAFQKFMNHLSDQSDFLLVIK